MKKNSFEILVGFLVVLLSCVFLIVVSKTTNKQNMKNSYELKAVFNNIEGINSGSDIKISGVKVGLVSNVSLNEDYKAELTLKLPKDLQIPVDSIFKISTSGLIGGKFINIKIGADEMYFENNEMVEFTESTIDLEDLISNFVFNSGNKK